MADEKKPVRWHACFGKWKDPKNCNGCIEGEACKAVSKETAEAKALKAAKKAEGNK